MAQGHAQARHYPIVVVWSEARIVRQRNASSRKLDTVLTQMILSTLFSKDAGAELKKTLERMDESE